MLKKLTPGDYFRCCSVQLWKDNTFVVVHEFSYFDFLSILQLVSAYLKQKNCEPKLRAAEGINFYTNNVKKSR